MRVLSHDCQTRQGTPLAGRSKARNRSRAGSAYICQVCSRVYRAVARLDISVAAEALAIVRE
jgi:hypothetical protein